MGKQKMIRAIPASFKTKKEIEAYKQALIDYEIFEEHEIVIFGNQSMGYGINIEK